MAHELSYKNGKAEAIFHRLPAWHREGIVSEDEIAWDKLLEIVDYEIAKVATKRVLPNGELADNSLAYSIIRVDTGAELGVVKGNYTVVQNRDAFECLKPLVDEAYATIYAAGVLRRGADAWCLVKWNLDRFPAYVQDIFGDELLPYAHVSNNHDGRRGILVGQTPIRIVCANTLGMAERDGVSPYIAVKHTPNAKSSLVEAAQTLFRGVIERYTVLAEQYKRLKETTLTDEAFQSLVLNTLTADPRGNKRFNPDAKTAELVIERHERRVNALKTLWHHGAGHSGDNSAWEAYNAAVEAVDHHSDLWPGRAGAYQSARILEGDLARAKQQVLNNLVDYASKQRKAARSERELVCV